MAGFVRKPKDLFAGLLFLALSVLTLYLAQDYSMGTARRMGPAYFPTMLAWILAALAMILVLRSLFGRRVAGERIALRPLLLVIGGTVAFAVLLRPAGLVLAVMAVVLIGACGSSQSRLLPAVLLASGLAAGCVVIFVVGLDQPFSILGDWFRN